MNNVKDNQMLSKFREDHRGSITPSHHAVNHEKTEAAPIFCHFLGKPSLKNILWKSFKISTGIWKINSNCMTRHPLLFNQGTKIHIFLKIKKQHCKHQTGPLWPKRDTSIARFLKKMKTKESLWKYHVLKLPRKQT